MTSRSQRPTTPSAPSISPTVFHEPLTRSVEDYLKAIYRLSGVGQPASTNEIADLLDLSAASVSGMVRRLSDQGLLAHAPYRGVELTPEGRRIALRMLRRHRLLEAYLVEFLGYSWDTVHDEAERLEHAVSDTLIERMAVALGNPRFDPHGDPIPDPDGAMAELVYTSLAEIPVGETAEIRRVDTSQAERLRFLGHSGLTPGTRVTVIERQPFRGPTKVRSGVAASEQVIGHELALQLLCVRIEAP
ncbi:MAG TPA: metal-dependent transcriptional regulator [Gemmatimonadales bacterium]|jgi:DtxR family Mn-dependent transcriptional regulator|nr:metal-dependent transcriptional regulator [Gemmatimonadales bacterium]